MFTSSHDRAMFTLGACFLLAKAINDLTGWPICAFWTGPEPYCEYDIHAFVRTPRGTYLDVEGERTEEEFFERWSRHGGWEIREVPSFDHISHWGVGMAFDPVESERRVRELAPVLVGSVTPCPTIRKVAPCPSQ